MYGDRSPGLLDMAELARVESVITSSAIEGIVVEHGRAERIIKGEDRRLRVRSEQEIAGYRDALDYLMHDDPGPLTLGLVLHLHRLLFGRTGGGGGQFKAVENLVVDRRSDGSATVRFTPASYRRTPFFMSELVDRYRAEQGGGRHHEVLLAGLVALDFLAIHPFVDGNGRVSRLLTTYLLCRSGYDAGRYVSLEEIVYTRRDAYYDALAQSTEGWHEGNHDPWPWLRYFVDVLAQAYELFARRVAELRSGISKQERVRAHVLQHAGTTFETAGIRRAVPGVSDQTIRLVLGELKKEGLIVPTGVGRGTRWVRRSPQESDG